MKKKAKKTKRVSRKSANPLDAAITRMRVYHKQSGAVAEFVPIPSTLRRSARPAQVIVKLQSKQFSEDDCDLRIGRDRKGLFFTCDRYDDPTAEFELTQELSDGWRLVCEDEEERVVIELQH
jgi:hypothetical protein